MHRWNAWNVDLILFKRILLWQIHPAHRVRSRMIGNRYIITLDIEVNPHITITQAHEIAGAVEKSIEDSIDNVYDILVHVEPAGECQTDEKFGVNKGMV